MNTPKEVTKKVLTDVPATETPVTITEEGQPMLESYDKDTNIEPIQPQEEQLKEVEVRRPDFKRSIFIGIQGKENNERLLRAVNEHFPEHHIHIMDREMFNQNTELWIKKIVAWKEQQKVLEYVSKPENIQMAISVAFKIKDSVGEDWFTLKDLVDNTNFNYQQASSVLDVQYAFGFLAKKTVEGRDLYKSIGGTGERLEYVKTILEGMEREITTLSTMYSTMQREAGIKEAGQEGG